MAGQSFVKAIPLQGFDVSGAGPFIFSAINPGGLEEACFMIRIINDSNSDLYISYDGVTRHDFVQATSDTVVQLPFQANSNQYSHIANLKKGTVVYVQGLPGIGFVYLAGYFQK